MKTSTVPSISTNPTSSRFGTGDGAFALLSLLSGILFFKYAITLTAGIGMTVLTFLFVAMTLIYVAVRGNKITIAAGVWGGILCLFSLTYTVTSNGFLKGWCIFFQLLATAYFVFVAFSNRDSSYADDMLGFHLIKSLFVYPFGNIHQSFAAIGESGKKQKFSKTVLLVLLGLCLALVPSLIVFALLTSGDTMFSNLVDYLFSDVGDIISKNFLSVFFGIPFGMLIFGLFYGASRKRYPNALTRQAKQQGLSLIRIAPSAVTCAALTPMLLIYVLFFISQAGYFFGAFANLKPEGYSFAEYAREGFFNLCAVCVINGLVILVVHFFTKRTGNQEYTPIAKIFVILFSLSSILLAVIALRKMVMYIDEYALTLSRVYSSWFMILLSVFFLILIVKQFWSKLNGTLCALLSFLILFGGLCLCNVDARVADYNVSRYLELGKEDPQESLDFYMFQQDLSYAAVGSVHKAYDQLDEKAKQEADTYLESCARRLASDLEWDYRNDYSFRSWDLDTARAEQILRWRYPYYFEDLPKAYGWAW